jgi:hypothetical protein
MLAVNCFMSVFSNITNLLVIQYTSPLTLQVSGIHTSLSSPSYDIGTFLTDGVSCR